jgi:predicted SnoaL-like aldol condensation-catalyzing enzyme
VSRLACLVAAVGFVGLLTGCGGSSAHIALPPVSASPQRVAAAYVAAINAHDVTTARALLTPSYRQLTANAPDSWFTNVESITHLRLSKPFEDRNLAHTLHYHYVLDVGADFVLKQRQVMSMPNGQTTWGFSVVRNSPRQRWLIGSEGTG